jgi:hypothetical protein
VALPASWTVDRLERAGTGTVLWVREAKPGRDPEQVMAYVAPSGVVRTLHNLDPLAFPIGPDGAVWVTARPPGAGPQTDEDRHGVDLVRPDTDEVVGSQSDIPADRMIAVLNDTGVLVRDRPHRVRTWPLSGPAQPGSSVDVHGTPWFLSGVAPDGRLLLRSPRQLHLYDPSGREVWAWDRAAGVEWNGISPAAFSPSGRYVVMKFVTLQQHAQTFLVLAAGTGEPVGDAQPGTPLAWEDEHTLIVTTDGYLERCDVVADTCHRLEVTPEALLAGAAGLDNAVQVGPAAPA